MSAVDRIFQQTLSGLCADTYESATSTQYGVLEESDAMELELFRETGTRPRDRCSDLLRRSAAGMVAAGKGSLQRKHLIHILSDESGEMLQLGKADGA
jgi:hypothetical protein